MKNILKQFSRTRVKATDWQLKKNYISEDENHCYVLLCNFFHHPHLFLKTIGPKRFYFITNFTEIGHFCPPSLDFFFAGFFNPLLFAHTEQNIALRHSTTYAKPAKRWYLIKDTASLLQHKRTLDETNRQKNTIN